MAELWSDEWNTADGVCGKHLLPSVPCPACLAGAKNDPEMVLRLNAGEREGLVDVLIPDGFNPDIHDVV